jgi:hypothetical protein
MNEFGCAVCLGAALGRPKGPEDDQAVKCAEDLACEPALGVNTVRRVEISEEATSLTAANDLAVRHALEAGGIEFIDENGGGPGIRLRERTHKKPGK